MPINGYIVDDNIIIFYNESFELLTYDFYNLQRTLLHELVHYISKQVPSEEKIKRREIFFQHYQGDIPIEESAYMEEPLAVLFGNIIFTKTFYSSNYKHYSHWYDDSWIQIISLLTQPIAQDYLQAGKTMDMKFIKTYAKVCSDVFKASESLNNRAKELKPNSQINLNPSL
tara:strand:- start:95 stop:607 length:513 start_codon:yes stop_codon:yes gene_type:complete